VADRNKSPGSEDSIPSPYNISTKSSPADWIRWFKNPLLQQGRLTLVRGGEDTFITQVLDVRSEGEGINLIVDRLLPLPDFDPNSEVVQFHANLIYMDAGMQVTTTFRAILAGTARHGKYEAVLLSDIVDLEVDSAEYIAELSDNSGIKLSLFIMGEWIKITPEHASINQIFFREKLDLKIGADGIAIPKASITLEDDDTKIPVQLQMYRFTSPEYVVKIEKIDSVARTMIVKIIEEIWKIDCGLSSRSKKKREAPVGYRSESHDIHAEAFEPHIFFLGEDEEWTEHLKEKGIVEIISTDQSSEVLEKIAGKRCDLVVGDADYWEKGALEVERTLRSQSKIRNIPRIWIADDPYKTFMEEVKQTDSDDQSSEENNQRDLLDFGAFDIICRNDWDNKTQIRLDWALGIVKDAGDIEYVEASPLTVMVTTNSRVRYRIGLMLLENKLKFEVLNTQKRLLSRLQDIKADKVVLDMSGLDASPEVVLEPLLRRARKGEYEVMLLVRSAKGEEVFDWMKTGVSDISILDASLRQTAVRVKTFVKGANL